MQWAPRSERGVSTKFHHRPVSRAGFEPAKLRLSTAGVCRLRHLDILVLQYQIRLILSRVAEYCEIARSRLRQPEEKAA